LLHTEQTKVSGIVRVPFMIYDGNRSYDPWNFGVVMVPQPANAVSGIQGPAHNRLSMAFSTTNYGTVRRTFCFQRIAVEGKMKVLKWHQESGT
jgi:hypothetical protein